MVGEWIALALFLVAASGPTGFKIVHILVQIIERMEKLTAIVINYNVYWLLISAVFLLIFVPPLYGIWYELHKQNKADEEAREYYRDLPDDDEKIPDDDWEVDDIFDKIADR